MISNLYYLIFNRFEWCEAASYDVMMLGPKWSPKREPLGLLVHVFFISWMFPVCQYAKVLKGWLAVHKAIPMPFSSRCLARPIAWVSGSLASFHAWKASHDMPSCWSSHYNVNKCKATANWNNHQSQKTGKVIYMYLSEEFQVQILLWKWGKSVTKQQKRVTAKNAYNCIIMNILQVNLV